MNTVTKGAVTIRLNACSRCGQCEIVCPTDVFRTDASSGYPIIRYPDDCHACHICEDECPEQCIEIDLIAALRGRKSVYDLKGIPLDEFNNI